MFLANKIPVQSTLSKEVLLPLEHANICLKDVLVISSLGYNLSQQDKSLTIALSFDLDGTIWFLNWKPQKR